MAKSWKNFIKPNTADDESEQTPLPATEQNLKEGFKEVLAQNDALKNLLQERQALEQNMQQILQPQNPFAKNEKKYDSKIPSFSDIKNAETKWMEKRKGILEKKLVKKLDTELQKVTTKLEKPVTTIKKKLDTELKKRTTKLEKPITNFKKKLEKKVEEKKQKPAVKKITTEIKKAVKKVDSWKEKIKDVQEGRGNKKLAEFYRKIKKVDPYLKKGKKAVDDLKQFYTKLDEVKKKTGEDISFGSDADKIIGGGAKALKTYDKLNDINKKITDKFLSLKEKKKEVLSTKERYKKKIDQLLKADLSSLTDLDKRQELLKSAAEAKKIADKLFQKKESKKQEEQDQEKQEQQQQQKQQQQKEEEQQQQQKEEKQKQKEEEKKKAEKEEAQRQEEKEKRVKQKEQEKKEAEKREQKREQKKEERKSRKKEVY
jgi:hypothetical protein